MNEYLKDLNKIDHLITHYALPFAWHLLGAFAVWIIGGFFIRAVQKLVDAALRRRHVDTTLMNYAHSTVGFVLRILLILAILGIFGIETTSLSAILAAAGVAIGVAWSGLLSNFAAGIFLIIFRPFKVGDHITAAGVTGVVREIGIFATTLDSSENARIFISNNKLFSENILNFSSNPYRIAVFRVQLVHEVNPNEAIDRLRHALQNMESVGRHPEVKGEIVEMNSTGPVLNLKAACHQNDYSAVVADGNRVIYQTLVAAKYPPPETKMVMVQKNN